MLPSPVRSLPCLCVYQPAALDLILWHARKIRLDVEDGRAVEHVDAVHSQLRAVAAEQPHDSQADGIGTLGRARGEHAVRPIVQWRVRDEARTLSAMKDPDHDQV